MWSLAKLKKNPNLIFVEKLHFSPQDNLLFPLATARNMGWTLDNYFT